ncbi:hypothetical protein GGR57DRAFT_509136 [Xylariaceae sp. FL1272]|nr:hypothetical protein GGR57DRAFT_509136 [Xylariaceae sp. FL1272]
MPLNGEFKPSSLYIALDPHEQPHPTLRHATNRDGPWQHEVIDFSTASRPLTAVLARVGEIRDQKKMIAVTQAIPAEGAPSARTGDPFNCRIWVLDVIAALAEENIVSLPASLDDVEETVAKCGARYAGAAERGEGATVVDDPFFVEHAACAT